MRVRERHGAARRGRRVMLAGVAAAALLGGFALASPVAGAAHIKKLNTVVNGSSVEVCKVGNVSGSFQFTVNGGAPISVAVNTCEGVAVEPGQVTVTELPDTSGATYLAGITVKPVKRLVSEDLSTQSVTVNVAASGKGSDVTTKFDNEPNSGVLKVCKVANDPSLVGQGFTFTEQSGGTVVGPQTIAASAPGATLNCTSLANYQIGTQVNVSEMADTGNPGVYVQSVTANGGTISNPNYGTPGMGGTVTVTVTSEVTQVIFYNNVQVNTPPGYLEICKNVGDAYVPAGPWGFTVTNSAGAVVDTEQVISGQCNENVNGLAPGNYTVTESVGYPYYVSSVSAIPSSALVSQNVNNAQATFTVTSQNTTTAFFTNDTLMGYVKVCKSLAPNAAALSGQTFNFNVADAAGTQTVSVMAQYGQTACSIDYTPLPAGSTATITEQTSPNTAVSGVQVVPPSAGTTTPTSATVTVSSTNINAGVFTNQAMGWVEVCKTAGDASVTGSFNFTVNGAPINPVAVGQCSQPIEVPAGTATINEQVSNPNYYVSGITAVGYAGSPIGNRLVSTSGTSSVVTVPYGGVGNETVVDYTNSTLTGLFKVCTAQTSPDAALAGDSFTYSYTYTVNGTASSGTVTLTVPSTGSTCSNLVGLIPVMNANGTPVTVSVTAQAPALIGVDLAAFGYQGNGSVVSAPPTPAGFPYTATFALGTGINAATFTNGATH